MRKIKLLTLLAALLFSAGMYMQAERVHIGLLYYNLNADNMTAEVTWSDDSEFFHHNYYPDLYDLEEVVVPSTVTYNDQQYTVTAIGEYAFDVAEMQSVTLPSTITHIGTYAFANTHMMRTIVLPDNQVYMEHSVFMNSGLTSFTLPAGWNTFEYNMFGTCDDLVSLSVAEGNPRFDSRDNCNAIIETATNKLMYGCRTTVIPASVTAIHEYAFWEVKTLASINIPNGVKTIGNSAFSGCKGLTSLSIPASLEEFDNTTFSGCINLESIVVDPANTHYDSRDNCNAIIETATNKLLVGCVNTSIPLTVTAIGNAAFALIKRLNTVLIPSNVATIEDAAFLECRNLRQITCERSTPPVLGGAVFAYDSLELMTLYVPCNSVDAYSAADQWKEIATIDAYAAETHEGDLSATVHWEIDCAGTLSITGTGVIPHYTNLSFAPWSVYKHLIKNIVIGEGITRVGNYAFNELYKVVSAVLPSTIDSIGLYAFNSCRAIGEVELQSVPQSMALRAFDGCSHLDTIWTPCGNETTYGNNNANELFPFYDKLYRKCGKKHPVFFGSCGANNDGSNLQWRFEEGLLSFTGSGAMADYLIDPDWKTIPWFNLEKFVQRINLPNGLTTIGANAFMGCENVQTVTIPLSVTSINEDAFNACTGMNTIYLFTPAADLTWDDDFAGDFPDFKANKETVCYLPTQAMKDAYEAKFTTVNVTFAVDENARPQACSDDKQGTFGPDNSFSWILTCEGTLYVMGSGVMPDFSYNAAPWQSKIKDVKAIVVQDGITTLGNRAFANCENATSVSIPESVTTINMSAFSGCKKLTEVPLPNGLITISSSCFMECSALTSLHIPATVTSIGTSILYGCSSMRTITVEPANPRYDSRDNCNGIIQTTVNKLVVACATTTIPNSVTSIAQHAYSSLSPLKSMIVPNSITTIESGAFSSCGSLKSVFIPASVVNLGTTGSIFETCFNVETIIVAPGNPKFDSRDNCNAIIETATNKLKAGCRSTVIPDGVKIIDWSALSGLMNMTSLTIPASVDSIANSGVSSLFGMESMTVLAVKPPKLAGTTMFASIDRSIPVYVPAESLSAYQNAPIWSTFTNYQPLTNKVVVSSPANHGIVTGTGIYDANSSVTLTAIPDEGFEFMQWSDGTMSNPMSLTVTKDTTIRALFAKQEQVEQAIRIAEATGADSKEVKFSFKPIEDATLYELKVYKNGKLAATVKMDDAGNIVGEIQWAAPSRFNIRKAPGDPEYITVTLTGIELGSEYTYTFDAYDDEDNCISAGSGSLETPTAYYLQDNASADAINALLTEWNGQTKDVSIVRAVQRNGYYNTLCLPFDMTASQIANSSLDGAVIKEFTNAVVNGDELQITLMPVSEIVAGKPYFVKYADATALSQLNFDDVVVNSAAPEGVTHGGLTMIGTYVPHAVTAQESATDGAGVLFLGPNNQLYWPNTAGTIKPFRAYFTLSLGSGAPIRRGMPARIIEATNTATGVENIDAQPSDAASVKVIENGVLYIIRNGEKYNAMGQIIK